MRALRVSQAQERLLAGIGYIDHDLVFARPDGRPWHPERFSRTFTEQVARHGFPPLSVHGLRHSWATLALQAGVHPKVVQERLGHSTIRHHSRRVQPRAAVDGDRRRRPGRGADPRCPAGRLSAGATGPVRGLVTNR